MAQKKITDLQLISTITSTLNIPVDNSIQTYRATSAQFKSFFNAQTILSKTAAYTVDIADELIFCSAASADYALTLPSASGISGKIFAFKRTDANFNYFITLTPAGAETIDGYSSVKLCTQNEYIEIISNGTNWIILNHKSNTPWVSYTPANSTGFGTLASVNLKWRRVGDSMQIQGGFTSGTMTGSTAELGIPTGLTIAGTTSSRMQVGYLTRASAAGPVVVVQGRTYLTFGAGGDSQGDIPGTSLLGNNEVVLMTAFLVPIVNWI